MQMGSICELLTFTYLPQIPVFRSSSMQRGYGSSACNPSTMEAETGGS
jgi:hypothetical protein